MRDETYLITRRETNRQLKKDHKVQIEQINEGENK